MRFLFMIHMFLWGFPLLESFFEREIFCTFSQNRWRKLWTIHIKRTEYIIESLFFRIHRCIERKFWTKRWKNHISIWGYHWHRTNRAIMNKTKCWNIRWYYRNTKCKRLKKYESKRFSKSRKYKCNRTSMVHPWICFHTKKSNIFLKIVFSINNFMIPYISPSPIITRYFSGFSRTRKAKARKNPIHHLSGETTDREKIFFW